MAVVLPPPSGRLRLPSLGNALASVHEHRQQHQHPQVEVAWSILWPSSPHLKVPEMRLLTLRIDNRTLDEGSKGTVLVLPAPLVTPPPKPTYRGLTDLPSELWQHILLELPACDLWRARSVHPSWKSFIEAHFAREFLRETRLVLQVDRRPSFHFFGTFPLGNLLEGEDWGWVEFPLPGEERSRPWWATQDRPRLARDGRHLMLGGKPYAVRVSIAGFLGEAEVAKLVEFDERGRRVRVDWRVLLSAIFGRGRGREGVGLGELMHAFGEREGRASLESVP